jgi:hypothetical protein
MYETDADTFHWGGVARILEQFPDPPVPEAGLLLKQLTQVLVNCLRSILGQDLMPRVVQILVGH